MRQEHRGLMRIPTIVNKRPFQYADDENNRQFTVHQGGLWEIAGSTHLSWSYPEISGPQERGNLTLHLSHTRCANPIRIEYDGERDGWVVFALAGFDSQTGEYIWGEAAFINGDESVENDDPSKGA